MPAVPGTNIISTLGDSRGDRSHAGIDFGMPIGTPIYNNNTVVVNKVYTDSLGGLSVVATDQTTGNRFYMTHLDQVPEGIQAGQTYDPGTLLAYSGNSGNAVNTPPHLHIQGSGDQAGQLDQYAANQSFSAGSANSGLIKDSNFNAVPGGVADGYSPQNAGGAGAADGGLGGMGGAAAGAGGSGGGAGCIGGGMLGGLMGGVLGGLTQGLGMGLNGALQGALGGLANAAGLGSMGGILSQAAGLIGGGNPLKALTSGAFGVLSQIGAAIAPGLTNVIPSALQSVAGSLLGPVTSIIGNPLNLPNVVQQFASNGGLGGMIGVVGANIVGNFAGGTLQNLFSNIGLSNAISNVSNNVVGAVTEASAQTFGDSVAGGLGTLIQNASGLVTYGLSALSNNLAYVGGSMLATGNFDISNLTRLFQPANIAAQILNRGLGDVTGLTASLANANIPLATLDNPLNDSAVQNILNGITSTVALQAVSSAFNLGANINSLGQLTDMRSMLGTSTVDKMSVKNFRDLGRYLVQAQVTNATTLPEVGSALMKVQNVNDLNHVAQMPTPMHKPAADLVLNTWGFGSNSYGGITSADMMASATGHVYNDTIPVILANLDFLKTQPAASDYFSNVDKLQNLIAGNYIVTHEVTTVDPETMVSTTTTYQDIEIPGVGTFNTLDDAVAAMIVVFESSLTALNASTDPKIKDALNKISVAYNASVAHMLREVHLWNLFDFNIKQPQKLTPMGAYAFTLSLVGYAQDTGYGRAADVIQRLTSNDFYGQSIIAMMRQARNASVLNPLGVPTEKYNLPASDYYRNPLQVYQQFYTGTLSTTPMSSINTLQMYPTTLESQYLMERDTLLVASGYDPSSNLLPAEKDQLYGNTYWYSSDVTVRQHLGEIAVGTAIKKYLRIIGSDSIVLFDLTGNRVPIGKLLPTGIDNLDVDSFISVMFTLVNKILYGIAVPQNANPFFTDEIIYGVAEMMGELNANNAEFLLTTKVGDTVLGTFLTSVINKYKSLGALSDTTMDRNQIESWGGSGPDANSNFNNT